MLQPRAAAPQPVRRRHRHLLSVLPELRADGRGGLPVHAAEQTARLFVRGHRGVHGDLRQRRQGRADAEVQGHRGALRDAPLRGGQPAPHRAPAAGPGHPALRGRDAGGLPGHPPPPDSGGPPALVLQQAGPGHRVRAPRRGLRDHLWRPPEPQGGRGLLPGGWRRHGLRGHRRAGRLRRLLPAALLPEVPRCAAGHGHKPAASAVLEVGPPVAALGTKRASP
mmetsp:Transcript_69654/g.196470  ORF Transcript_69654/g.196470 Transcript_69654/m.196470 type:complete len:223 (-) Transcript_69654:215-883(-)